jgi:hypothetical protein
VEAQVVPEVVGGSVFAEPRQDPRLDMRDLERGKVRAYVARARVRVRFDVRRTGRRQNSDAFDAGEIDRELGEVVTDAVRPPSYPRLMANKPSRIDLLELDIDLRLTDLWREAGEITEWNLDVVAAFMRAAYGKGYCDALTEDAPGSLCHDHGYRIPARRRAPAHD